MPVCGQGGQSPTAATFQIVETSIQKLVILRTIGSETESPHQQCCTQHGLYYANCVWYSSGPTCSSTCPGPTGLRLSSSIHHPDSKQIQSRLKVISTCASWTANVIVWCGYGFEMTIQHEHYCDVSDKKPATASANCCYCFLVDVYSLLWPMVVLRNHERPTPHRW